MVLIPMSDMINHANPPEQIEWEYDDELGGLEINAAQPIPKDAEILATYGDPLSNSVFFISYGFVQKSNEADEVWISLKVETPERVIDLIPSMAE